MSDAPGDKPPSNQDAVAAGQAVLSQIRLAVAGLRPDIAATILTAALADLGVSLSDDRRATYLTAIQEIIQECWRERDLSR